MVNSIKNIIFILLLSVSFFSFYLALFLILFYDNGINYLKVLLLDKGLIVFLFSLTPLAIGISFFLSNYLKNKLSYPVYIIEVFKRLNSLDDLTGLTLREKSILLKEQQDFLIEIENFISKIRNIAVDKNQLYSLMKLFEKYMVTFENLNKPEDFIRRFILDTQEYTESIGYFFVTLSNHDIDLYLIDNIHFYEELKEKIKEIILQNGLSGSLGEKIVYLNQENCFFIQFKRLKNVPVIVGCIGGVILKNKIDNANRIFILESILTFFINIKTTIKILSKSINDIKYLSVRDSLTNLYNQRAFWDELNFKVELAKKNNKKLAVIVIDLDNFKKVNDKYGHYVGDKVIKDIGNILNKIFLGDNFIARYGGDEFAGIIYNSDINSVVEMASLIKEEIYNKEFIISNNLVIKGITTTIGIAIFPDNAQTAKDLFILADNMVLKGKNMYKNSVIVPEKDEVLSFFKDDADLSLKLMEALKKKSIKLNFQPIYSFKTKKVFGYEVLSRLDIDEFIVTADKFIGLIHKLKLSNEFDFLVVEKVFERIFEEKIDKLIFVNITPVTLSNLKFLNIIEELANRYDIDREKIVFEIVERETTENFEKLVDNCQKIKNMGYKFAIDDFGSGYSSFLYLKALPIEFVKVEGNFVKGMKQNLKDKLIVDAITNICKIHNVEVIAEYIENEEILNEAINLGINLGQGFYLGKPQEVLNLQ